MNTIEWNNWINNYHNHNCHCSQDLQCLNKSVTCYRSGLITLNTPSHSSSSSSSSLISTKELDKSPDMRKKYCCPIENCTKTCISKANMTRHINAHKKTCDYCKKIYSLTNYNKHHTICKEKNQAKLKKNTSQVRNYTIDQYFLPKINKNINN